MLPLWYGLEKLSVSSGRFKEEGGEAERAWACPVNITPLVVSNLMCLFAPNIIYANTFCGS